MTKFAVVDLETTGHSPSNGDQIIEVGIVIVENGLIVDQYATYVNPGKEIPQFISNLTGIKDDEVKKAPKFRDVAQIILDLCKDAYFVAHHVQFDLVFLNEALINEGFDSIKEKVIDTVELSRIFTPLATGFKLSQLAHYYNIQHKDPHRALSDAYVTAELLIKLLDKGRALPLETLEELALLEHKFRSDLFDILSGWIQEKRYSLDNVENVEIYQGLALKKVNQENVMESSLDCSYGEYLDKFLNENGKLHALMSEYEPRESQREMAEMIMTAFHEENHALIEAETGTGKTLAYLLPSIYHSIKNEEKVLVSTYTTQLQSQLLEKEIPLLLHLIPNGFKAVVLKGKNHYLSLKMFYEELQKDASHDNYDVILTKALILVWLTETETGDIDELQLPSSGHIFWRKINAEAERIIDTKSPWFSRNFYQRLRRKAQAANLIITNHSLLCADIFNNYQLIPAYDYAIIDEAHHLDKMASKQFGKQLNYVSIQYLINELIEEVNNKKAAEMMLKGKERADDLFRYIFSLVQHQKDNQTTLNDVGRIQYLFDQNHLDNRTATHLKDLAQRFVFILKDIVEELNKEVEKLANEEKDNKPNMEKWNRRIEQINDLIEKIQLFLFSDDRNLIKWIEIEALGAKNAVYLYSEPVEVGQILAEKFYREKKSVVLTSATLTVRNSFDYILEKNGISSEQLVKKKIDSPFSFEEQVQLLVPSDLPHIKYDNEDDYITAISYTIYELAQITEGRMLILFTSYSMLKNTHEMLKNYTDQDDIILISQGISSGSRSRLKKNFQSYDKAILLGTSSFWEGVDIPGEDLSLVVIVKLPFEPPNHPVFSAKAEALKEKGLNPFMDLALPNAVIRFKQGFGRLIRSRKDRGIVFVCDSRLINSKYSKYFTDSIPKVPIIYDEVDNLLKKAKEWFHNFHD